MDEKLSKTPMYQWGWGRWFEETWFDESYDSWSSEKVWDQVSQGELPHSVHRTRAMNLQRIGAKPC